MAQRSAGSQYMRLAEHLTQQIQDGVYREGDLLPSEALLCEQFGISRITARAALDELQSRGTVSRRAGVGTRVLPKTAQRTVFAHEGGSIDEVLRFTSGVPLKVLARSEFTVSADDARDLKLAEGQRFTRLFAVRQAKDQRIAASVHYVPTLLMPSAQQLNKVRGSLAQFVADLHGDQIQTIRQDIGACLLEDAYAEVLQRPAGSAAVTSRRWYLGREDRLILLSVSVFPADQYQFESVLIRNATR